VSIGDERLEHLRTELERLREQTDDGTATKIGITDSRYQRALNNVEKVLIDYADDLKGEPKTWPPIVLLALDILGTDTDDLGWAPHAERAERMGW
jgi:hypothetical protein